MTVPQVHQGDCVDMLNGMPETSVNLIVTSPPYNVGIEYDGYDDRQEDAAYHAWTLDWLRACYRVLKDDGRMCLNIPLDTGGNPTFGYEMVRLTQEVGLNLKTTIIWNEQNISRGTAWGSWMSASAPHVIAPVELILVLYKTQWKRIGKGTSTITADEFKTWAGAGGVWAFPGERRNGHPAPFPVELPRRCLKLFSYQEDVILDPFAGSGSTGIAAMETGRQAVLIEQSERYCREIELRLSDHRTLFDL
jgi:site-specific DNA-methyltransferase (adenine-specific)